MSVHIRAPLGSRNSAKKFSSRLINTYSTKTHSLSNRAPDDISNLAYQIAADSSHNKHDRRIIVQQYSEINPF